MPIPESYGFSWDDYDKILVERVVMLERWGARGALWYRAADGSGLRYAAPSGWKYRRREARQNGRRGLHPDCYAPRKHDPYCH